MIAHSTSDVISEETMGQVDLSPLVGNWVNSHRDTGWIKRFTISKAGGSFVIHTFGVEEPLDWGEARLSAYAEASGELAFYCVYDLGFMDAIFAANRAKGLIVIAAFYKFGDGSGRCVFNREFYFREE